MIVKSFVAGLMLLLAGSNAMAAVSGCTSSSSLTTLGPPGIAAFGELFTATGSYMDCYEFSLTSAASSVGGALELDPSRNLLDIAVTDISLFAGGVEIADLNEDPLHFVYSGLLGGAGAPIYTLAVSSVVSQGVGRFFSPVGYVGVLTTEESKALPEPGSVALLAATLLGLFAVRRSRRA